MDLILRYIGLFFISTIQMFSVGVYAFMNAVTKSMNEYFKNIIDAKSSYDIFFRIGEIPMFILAFVFAGKLDPFILMFSCSLLITVTELIFRYFVLDSKNKYIWFTVTVFHGGAYSVIKTLMKLCIAALFPFKEKKFKKKLAFYLSFMILIPNVLYIIVCKKVKNEVNTNKTPVSELYKKFYWYVFFGPLICLIVLIIGKYCQRTEKKLITRKQVQTTMEKEETKKDNTPLSVILVKAFKDCRRIWVLIVIGALSENVNILLTSRKSEFIDILKIPYGSHVYLIDRYMLLTSPIITFLLQKQTWLIDYLFKIQTILLSLGSILFTISAAWSINNIFFHILLNIVFSSSNFLFKNTFPAVFLLSCSADTSKVAFLIQMCFRSILLQILLFGQVIIFRSKSEKMGKFVAYYIYISVITLINLVLCLGVYWMKQIRKKNKVQTKIGM